MVALNLPVCLHSFLGIFASRALALVWWFIRGIVKMDDTLLYWLVSDGEPYIFDADKRREHFTFNS